MRAKGGRAVLLLVSSFGLLRPAAAQQSFPASVDLVAVDVTVVDKQGRPLSDLRQEDFSVQVGGKPRRVVAAQLVGSASPQPVTGESTPPTPAAVAPAFSSNRDTPRGRLFVLVFDVGFMTTGGGAAAVEAAERFVARLGPQDHVALVTLPTGPKGDFTTDHSRVAEAVRKVRGGRWFMKGQYNLSLAEAFGEADSAPYAYKDLWVAALARECRGIPAGCPQSLRSEAVRMRMSAQATADTSVSALRGLLGGLRAIEGPKNMVLVSQGLVTGGSADPGANRRLDVLADDFARARTSLYTIHVDRTIADATDTAERLASATWFDDKALYLDGLEAIAGYTGGPLLRAQTTVDFAFERVALETSAGWLLSFEPEGSDRDGKAHDIRVKVARDGVELRARPRFVVDTKQTAPRSSEARARQSLDALLPDVDVPLAVTTLALNGNGGDIRLMVAAEVGLDSAEGTALGQRLVDAHGALVKGAITTGVLEPVLRAERPRSLRPGHHPGEARDLHAQAGGRNTHGPRRQHRAAGRRSAADRRTAAALRPDGGRHGPARGGADGQCRRPAARRRYKRAARGERCSGPADGAVRVGACRRELSRVDGERSPARTRRDRPVRCHRSAGTRRACRRLLRTARPRAAGRPGGRPRRAHGRAAAGVRGEIASDARRVLEDGEEPGRVLQRPRSPHSSGRRSIAFTRSNPASKLAIEVTSLLSITAA